MKAKLRGLRLRVRLVGGHDYLMVQVVQMPFPVHQHRFLDRVLETMPAPLRSAAIARERHLQQRQDARTAALSSQDPAVLDAWLGTCYIQPSTLHLVIPNKPWRYRLSGLRVQSDGFAQQVRRYFEAAGLNVDALSSPRRPHLPCRMQVESGKTSFATSNQGVVNMPKNCLDYSFQILNVATLDWVDLPFFVSSRPSFEESVALFDQLRHALPEVQVSEQQGEVDDPTEPHWTKAQVRSLQKKKGKQNVITMPKRVAWNELYLPDATMDALFPGGVPSSDRRVEIKYGVFGCESLSELTVRIRRPNGSWHYVDDEAVLRKVWEYFLLLRKEEEEGGRPWADGLTYAGLSS